jgi:hypothetical protein
MEFPICYRCLSRAAATRLYERLDFGHEDRTPSHLTHTVRDRSWIPWANGLSHLRLGQRPVGLGLRPMHTDLDDARPQVPDASGGYSAATRPVPGAPMYVSPAPHRHPLIVGLAVVVLLALVVVVFRVTRPDPPVAAPEAGTQAVTTTDPATTDPGSTPTGRTGEAAPDPLSQARAIDALLGRSGASRDKLNSAIDRVGRCTGVGGALDDLRTVGQERRAQIAAVRDADLSALADGESLRSLLVTALQHSLDADAAYVEWAEPTLSGGCANTAVRRSAYARGRSASDQAGKAKQALLAAWNPVAMSLGLPPRDRQSI